MAKKLEKILNYFTGRDILEYYKRLEQRYQKCDLEDKEIKPKIKSLKKQRNKYFFYGAILPNIIDIGATVYLALNNSYILSPIIIGMSEGMRLKYRDKFRLDNEIELNKASYKKARETMGQANQLIKEIRKSEEGILKIKKKTDK